MEKDTFRASLRSSNSSKTIHSRNADGYYLVESGDGSGNGNSAIYEWNVTTSMFQHLTGLYNNFVPASRSVAFASDTDLLLVSSEDGLFAFKGDTFPESSQADLSSNTVNDVHPFKISSQSYVALCYDSGGVVVLPYKGEGWTDFPYNNDSSQLLPEAVNPYKSRSFVIDGVTYLAVAAGYEVVNTVMNSLIYRWNEQNEFELVQSIETRVLQRMFLTCRQREMCVTLRMKDKTFFF